jgi:hypothetical protein
MNVHYSAYATIEDKRRYAYLPESGVADAIAEVNRSRED